MGLLYCTIACGKPAEGRATSQDRFVGADGSGVLRDARRLALSRTGPRRTLGRFDELLLALCLVALSAGWLRRGERVLTAEEGLGYALGIAGSLMMLGLLIYPLRKRIRALRALGRVGHWFRAHMIFGVVGPTLIFFHSNFGLGSTNSSVALLSMSLVVLSGLVGRHLYGRVHHGLYGQRVFASELLAEARLLRPDLDALFAAKPELLAELVRLENAAVARPAGLIGAFVRAAAVGRDSARIERQILRNARDGWRGERLGRRELRCRLDDVRLGLGLYLGAIRRVATLAVFERLFALWHVLHLPLFIMLVLAAITHVVAVHLY